MTYVGKDIAYHLWKFGLLGRDFGYKPFFQYSDRECWISTDAGREPNIRNSAARRRSTTSSTRASPIRRPTSIEALRGMGYTEQADHYTHFGYEMVALTPRCAVELGYEVSAGRPRQRLTSKSAAARASASKADDLIDKLIAATRRRSREAPDRPRRERSAQRIAEQIAIGALRYFMLKFTRNSVIAFDFKRCA